MAFIVTGALTAATAAMAADGAALYQQHCASCHQAGGTGLPGAFPPLAGNPRVQDANHVRSVITAGLTGPIEVGGVTYRGSMPSFGGQLSDADVEALIAYVQSAWGNGEPTGGTQADGDQAPAPPAAAPDPQAIARGRALFTGRRRLQNGGTPCSACHGIDGVDALVGGSMGRDLTSASDRLGGAAGLRGVLTNIAFPVMRQAFATHPLTTREVDDLVAYLQDRAATAQAQGTAGRDPSRFGFNWLWLFGAVGAALLFALLLVGWPRQRESVAQHLRRTGRLGRHRP